MTSSGLGILGRLSAIFKRGTTSITIRIKHGFFMHLHSPCPEGDVENLGLRPEAEVFNTSQGTWRMLMH